MRLLDDVDSVARHAAELIATEARAAVRARGRITVAISGGRTPWVMLCRRGTMCRGRTFTCCRWTSGWPRPVMPIAT